MLAIEFSETINLGGILIIVFGVAAALFFTVRSNVAKYWREVAEAEQRRVAQLQEKILGLVPKESLETAILERDEQRALKHEAISDAAALRLTRDLTPLIKSQQHMMERFMAFQEEGEARYGLALKEVRDLFAQHEERAQERHEQQIEAMRLIADRLANGT